jgi:hypothetical protein
MVQAGLGKNARPWLKNAKAKKGWKHSSSGRVQAYQVQSPEFKPQNQK